MPFRKWKFITWREMSRCLLQLIHLLGKIVVAEYAFDLAAQEHVNTEGAVIVSLIFYSDQTSLSQDGKVSGHPLVLSVGNISCENRYLDKGHALLAIFPILPSTELTHLERFQLFQSCLEHVLKQLKDASKTGILLLDPTGEERWVYPRLYAYVCNHPEGCKVTCTFDTNKCVLPCSMCLCPSDKLRDVHERFP